VFGRVAYEEVSVPAAYFQDKSSVGRQDRRQFRAQRSATGGNMGEKLGFVGGQGAGFGGGRERCNPE
jgi:hypothetical protein